MSLGYDQGLISDDRYIGEQHGRVSSDSLERPEALRERKAPILFSLSLSL